MKKICLGVIALFTLVACEKDDLCDGGESETPNVIINLFDRLNSETPKPAVKIALFTDNAKDSIFFKNQSKIEIPLKITGNETVWNVMLYDLNETNDTITKVDQIRFTYNPEALYVSKACGYKTIFHNFNATIPTNLNWIQSIYKLTSDVSNQDNAHIQLFY